MARTKTVRRIGPAVDGVSAVLTTESFVDEIEIAEERARARNFGHAAAIIRKDAIASIVPDPLGKPSPKGRPVATRRGLVRRAIVYAADKYGAVIGPTANLVGTSMSAHEFGGEYKGGNYPARPTMGPALSRNTDRFAGSWRGSIGS